MKRTNSRNGIRSSRCTFNPSLPPICHYPSARRRMEDRFPTRGQSRQFRETILSSPSWLCIQSPSPCVRVAVCRHTLPFVVVVSLCLDSCFHLGVRDTRQHKSRGRCKKGEKSAWPSDKKSNGSEYNLHRYQLGPVTDWTFSLVVWARLR